MTIDLYTRTLNLLRRDKRTLHEIAEGAQVNIHWLGKFKQGRFDNPGVRTVEQLYRFLRKKPHRKHRSPSSPQPTAPP